MFLALRTALINFGFRDLGVQDFDLDLDPYGLIPELKRC